MNAIQYFDWGGTKKYPITIVVKDFFSKQIGRNIEHFFPIRISSPSMFQIGDRKNVMVNRPQRMYLKESELLKRGNDFVYTFSLNSSFFNDSKVYLLSFSFYSNSTNFPLDHLVNGKVYINGRKLKDTYCGDCVHLYLSNTNTITLSMAMDLSGENHFQYEDGADVKIRDLREGEVVFVFQ